MPTAATWLLVLCTNYTPAECYYHGGATAILVTEAQCKAALGLSRRLTGWCVSPTGEVIKSAGAE